MRIELAVKSDIPLLCDLLASLFSQEAEFRPDRDIQAHGLRRIIESPGVGDVLVAREGGKIVGMVNILYTISTALGSRVGILEDMVVSESMRGRGVGSALIERALEHSRQNGCKRITLLTDADNAGAHKFYQRHGFFKSRMIAFRKRL